jgi:hypothetical protein
MRHCAQYKKVYNNNFQISDVCTSRKRLQIYIYICAIWFPDEARVRRVPAIETWRTRMDHKFYLLSSNIFLLSAHLPMQHVWSTNGFLIIFFFSLVKCFCWFLRSRYAMLRNGSSAKKTGNS